MSLVFSDVDIFHAFTLHQGIWASPLNTEQWLGPDPFLCERKGQTPHFDSPCGLKNLGATCYLNVLVQTIVFNLVMRDAILNVDISDAARRGALTAKVISSLQSVVAHMISCEKNVYSLDEFVGAYFLYSCVIRLLRKAKTVLFYFFHSE